MTAPHTIAYQVLHEALVTRFNAASDAQTAEWFTRYLKGVIQYRGLKTGQLKGILKAVFDATGADGLPSQEQLGHIRYWLRQPMAEDKLTAILWLKHWLRKESRNGTGIASVIMALEMLEDVFRAGDIYDWSTNDWLCVRVLETIPIQYPSLIERLMDWVDALSIWQRRSALLAFKKSAKQGQHHKVVEALIERLLPTDKRFIQTAIGWVLSDASRKHAVWSEGLFERHFALLSHEVIVRHTKYLETHQALKDRSRAR